MLANNIDIKVSLVWASNSQLVDVSEVFYSCRAAALPVYFITRNVRSVSESVERFHNWMNQNIIFGEC